MQKWVFSHNTTVRLVIGSKLLLDISSKMSFLVIMHKDITYNTIDSVSCITRHFNPRLRNCYLIRFSSEQVPPDCAKLMSYCYQTHLSRIVRKPDFCLGENKGADQLRGNREADQRLCFRYSDSTIPLLLKSEISSF